MTEANGQTTMKTTEPVKKSEEQSVRKNKRTVALYVAQDHLLKISKINHSAAKQEALLAMSQIDEILNATNEEVYKTKEAELIQFEKSQGKQ